MPLHGSTITGIVIGAPLLFGPRILLEAFTGQNWEIGVLRFVGLATFILGLLWEGARPIPDRALGSAQQRALLAWALIAGFIIGKLSVMLVLGVSLLMAAAAEMGLERAMAYSESVRRLLEPPDRPPRPGR
jgi:hypothetical protein